MSSSIAAPSSSAGTAPRSVERSSKRAGFPWNNGKFPELTDPDPSYHGMSFYNTFGGMNIAYILKIRTQLLRDLGRRSARSMPGCCCRVWRRCNLRMERHCDNALAVAKFLASHKKVSWVGYAGLESHASYSLAKKYMPRGPGAVFGFGIAGATPTQQRENGIKLINNVKLFSHLANIGDSKSLINPSEQHDAPAADAGRAGQHGCDPGLRASVDRDRRCERHHRGPEAGAGRGVKREIAEFPTTSRKRERPEMTLSVVRFGR